MPESLVTNEDCMEMMARYPDNFFDLAIVDPPYGIKESAHRNISRSKLAKTTMYKKEFWDYETPGQDYFDELFRVSKNQIIWGGNYFLNHLGATRCFIVWNKCNIGTNFADCELAWTNFKSSVRMFSFMWNGMMQGSIADGKRNNGDKSTNEVRIHPTQKPVQLYRWCMQKYAATGYKILDTHLGSGSSRIAAYEAAYDFYGTELDTDYFNSQEERFTGFLKTYEKKRDQVQLHF